MELGCEQTLESRCVAWHKIRFKLQGSSLGIFAKQLLSEGNFWQYLHFQELISVPKLIVHCQFVGRNFRVFNRNGNS